MKKLEGNYNPKDFEDAIYEKWNEKGYFKPNEDRSKGCYSIVMPPPNITGKLHAGHALDDTIQDILIRYKRMQGISTLWVPGTDHAAIATEAKIVAKLKEEGLTKEDLGRDEFMKRAWEWKKEYGNIITSQVRKLGCSCDWSRERFTMDEGLTKAVQKVFVDLYNKGLIYKGKRMINWCPYCNTSISDAEVEYEEESSHLWHIRYKVEGEDDKYVIVATTRPETMLGDTAVAVHPSDDRYKDIVGKNVILPIMNKPIPVIADRFVETEFGTGCVKITPAHDINDYQAGLNHGLDIIEVFDENRKMKNLVPEYEGMDALEVRPLIVEKLKKIGALVKIEDYNHNVGKCYRCHNVIEPMISDQWFVKMEELAKPAIEAVKNKEIKFIPERFEKNYFHWMENIQDWCISRQLWWGHRIPAYYCEDCGNIEVEITKPEKCSKCGSTKLVQDEDTLDTWFSSALWPFSTMGWPEETDDLKNYFPTNTLVTAYDIITFWVSRMIVSSLEQTGKRPFEHVFIHGIVRDSQGRKMSKSLGNGIDPLEIIDKYGTDGLRFSLILGISPGNDVRYMPERLESARNFANKLWNVSKFVMMNIEEMDLSKADLSKLTYEDKWIITKLNNLKQEVKSNLDKFELGVALQKIYDFIWGEFCDWYIEMTKARLYDKNSNTRIEAGYVLKTVLIDSLKLLHLYMPFITEEIFTKISDEESIMISNWPEYDENDNYEKAEEFIEKIKDIIVEIRNIRTKMNVHPSKKSKLIFVTTKYKKEIEDSKQFINKLGFGNEVNIKETEEEIPSNAISIIRDDLKLFIPFEDLVDIEQEKMRLEEEKKKVLSEITRAEKMLSNPGFTSKAPKVKIEEEEAKLVKYKAMLEDIENRLSNM